MSLRSAFNRFFLLIPVIVLLTACETLSPERFGVDDQEATDRFGAIAFSASTQRWHIRWNVTGQDRADSLALQYCGTSDCSVVLRFGPGQCGTFSLGDSAALGVGLGATEEEAAKIAFDDCTQSGQSCKIAPVRCNDQS